MDFEPDQPIRRRELRGGGYTDWDILRMRRSGEIRDIRRGAYRTGAPVSPEEEHLQRVAVAVEKLSDVVAVSHVSAAVVLGLPIWRIPLSRVQVSRNTRRSGGRIGGEVHVRVVSLDPEEVVEIGGIRVTSPARTLVDVARTVPFEQAVVLADAALREGMVDAEPIAAALAKSRRWPGASAARRALAFADGRSESVGESRSRVAITRAGLPVPDLQFEVRTTAGGLAGRTDFGWRRHRAVGEFDGRVKYGRLLKPGQEPGDVVFAEKRREDDIRSEGYGVARWVWEELDAFGPVAARIRRAFQAAA